MSFGDQQTDKKMFGSAQHGSTAGMTCARCEQLLMDAMDGTLAGEEKAAFDVHLHHCTECLKKFEEGKRGLAWLEMLKSVQPEPSADLVNRILMATSGVAAVHADSDPTERKVLPFRVKSLGQGALRFGRIAIQPRLAMTAAMAFFSLAVTANLFGVHVTQFRFADLRPANLKKNFYRTSASAVRYYDNLRVVYELQSRVREMRADDGDSHSGSEKPLESAPAKESKPPEKKDEKSKGSSFKEPSWKQSKPNQHEAGLSSVAEVKLVNFHPDNVGPGKTSATRGKETA